MKVGKVGLSVLVVLGVSVGGSASAHASTSLTSAIRSQDHALRSLPAYRDLKHLHVSSVAQAKGLLPKFAVLRTKLNDAATAVSGADARGKTQKHGQTDWVSGAREIASGVGQFETALRDGIAGRKAAAKVAVDAGARDFKAGNRLGGEADKLLGLPAGD